MLIRDLIRARELLATSLGRNLDDSEVQEAVALVRRFKDAGRPAEAAWAYQAIRLTYERRHKARDRHLPLRAWERTAKALVEKARNVARAGTSARRSTGRCGDG